MFFCRNKGRWGLAILLAFLAPSAFSTGALVAVSLGMPDGVLGPTLAQASQLGIPVIIRGVWKNVGATRERVQALVGHQKLQGISIDPVAFRAFKIKSVPALVVFDGFPCGKDQKSAPCPENTFDIVWGNIPLVNHLGRIGERSPSLARRQFANKNRRKKNG